MMSSRLTPTGRDTVSGGEHNAGVLMCQLRDQSHGARVVRGMKHWSAPVDDGINDDLDGVAVREQVDELARVAHNLRLSALTSASSAV